MLPEGIEIARVNCWHKANLWAYDLCCTPAILDYVEDVIGPDFFLWGAQFFCKFPGDGTVVPWHQDAHYWPLSPKRAVTAWLAVFDADASNSAMQVVRRSHRRGEVVHHERSGPQFILPLEVDPATIDRADIVTLDLKAGEISLHDDGLIHGSGPNTSDRMRCGYAMRFSPSEVKCDLSVWPHFEAYPVRGEDADAHNPVGKIPTSDGFPTTRFQHSSDFV